MATVAERLNIAEEAIERRFDALERRFDSFEKKLDARFNAFLHIMDTKVSALDAKMDRNHQTVMASIAEANKAQMEILKEMKDLGSSPNY